MILAIGLMIFTGSFIAGVVERPPTTKAVEYVPIHLYHEVPVKDSLVASVKINSNTITINTDRTNNSVVMPIKRNKYIVRYRNSKENSKVKHELEQANKFIDFLLLCKQQEYLTYAHNLSLIRIREEQPDSVNHSMQ